MNGLGFAFAVIGLYVSIRTAIRLLVRATRRLTASRRQKYTRVDNLVKRMVTYRQSPESLAMDSMSTTTWR